LGDFESSCNKFAYKRSPKRLTAFGLSRNSSINLKTAVDILGNFWKHLGNIFASTSGRTAHKQKYETVNILFA